MPVDVKGPGDLGAAFETFRRERADIVLVFAHVMFTTVRRQIAAFALASRLPTVYSFREFRGRRRADQLRHQPKRELPRAAY